MILQLSANVGEIPMLRILAKARMYQLGLDAWNCAMSSSTEIRTGL